MFREQFQARIYGISSRREAFARKNKREQRGGWVTGGMPTLKTMETASRTLKRGRERTVCRSAGILPERLQESGKQVKTPMFSIISRALGGATSRSRPCGWSEGGKRKDGGRDWGDGRPARPEREERGRKSTGKGRKPLRGQEKAWRRCFLLDCLGCRFAD